MAAARSASAKESAHVVVDAAALRALRTARGLSQERLGTIAGVSDKTVRLLESGRQSRTLRTTADLLARALDAPVASIARSWAPPPSASATADAALPPAPPSPRPRLADLVAAERALARDRAAPRAARDGTPRLTAQAFQNVMTAFLAHDGERFEVVGTVDEQRGVAIAEAAALGGVCGLSARFRVRVVLETGALLGVTVHTVDAKETRAMQALLGDAATLRVRVVGLRVEDDAAARKFAWFDSEKSHPWTFAVERVEAADR